MLLWDLASVLERGKGTPGSLALYKERHLSLEGWFFFYLEFTQESRNMELMARIEEPGDGGCVRSDEAAYPRAENSWHRRSAAPRSGLCSPLLGVPTA